MSQIIETVSLSVNQVQIVLKNLFRCQKVKNVKKIYEGKPRYGKDTDEKYNLKRITKFASKYELYIGKLPNDDDMIYIVFYENKFDAQHYYACEWFYHLFEDKIKKRSVRPRVYIMPSYFVTEAMHTHIPDNLMKCNYRVVSLVSMYFLIGSRTRIFGTCYNYKVIPHELYINGKDYPIIKDSDIICKIFNVIVGECVVCERVLNENGAYVEKAVRTVVRTEKQPGVIADSGISYNEFKNFIPPTDLSGEAYYYSEVANDVEDVVDEIVYDEGIDENDNQVVENVKKNTKASMKDNTKTSTKKEKTKKETTISAKNKK